MTAELTKSANIKAAGAQSGTARAGGMGGIRTGNVVVSGPDVHVDGVEDSEEGKAPADAVNYDLLAAIEELVDNGAEKE